MKIKHLKTFSEKLTGLSFKNKIAPVFLETRWGIQTFFLKYPIDVVVCDDNFIVRKIVRSLQPRRILVWNPKYRKIFEFPAGYVESEKINYKSKFKPNIF